MDYETVKTEIEITSAEMTIDEAQQWKLKIGGTANQLRVLLYEGYEREVWRSLGFVNWEECLQSLADEFGLSDRHMKRLHSANRIESNVIPANADMTNWSPVNIPESQLRPLSGLEPEQQVEVWQEAVDTAPNGRVTAAHVSDVANRFASPPSCVTTDKPGILEPTGKSPEPELPSKMGVHFSSETPEHYTPQDFLFYVYECLGDVDLDPCSNSKDCPNVEAANHFTKDDNGLEQLWHGKVYMNPPYGREIIDWVGKLVDEYKAGRVTEAIALVPSRTDTQWWKLIDDNPFLLIEGRLKFSESENSAPFPSTAFYLGDNPDLFYHCFVVLGGMGKVYVSYKSGMHHD